MIRGRANRRKAVRQRRPLRMPRLPRITINWRALLLPPIVLGLLASALAAAQTWLDRPVRNLVVEGTFQRVPSIQIEAAVGAELTRGFLSLDLAGLRDRVQALDWVDEAQVARAWPDTLIVRVSEHHAAARWGETGLLNVRGELFTDHAQHAFPELPSLAGPPGSEHEVARRYLAVRGRLADAHFTLESLRMDRRGAWHLQLGSGQEIRLGRRDVDQRLARFFDVVAPVLAGEFQHVTYVDLRYTNGFAVGWQDGAAPGDRADVTKHVTGPGNRDYSEDVTEPGRNEAVTGPGNPDYSALTKNPGFPARRHLTGRPLGEAARDG